MFLKYAYAMILTCECGFTSDRTFNMKRHLETKQHILKTTKKCPTTKYECVGCNYSTNCKSNLSKHFLSTKHEMNKKREKPYDDDRSPVNATNMMDVFMKIQSEHTKQTAEMLKQNTEIIKILANKITSGVVTPPMQQNTLVVENNTTTIHKKFNLNIFLNQECKDAINLSDFITDIQVSMEDLEHLGEVGYAQGMSRILIKALREKNTRERPIHCTDVKREVMYVRKNDAWLKDDDKEEIHRLIRNIVSKNYKKMKEWCDQNPGYQVSDSPDYEIWYNISRNISNMDEAASKKLVSILAEVTAVEKSMVGVLTN